MHKRNPSVRASTRANKFCLLYVGTLSLLILLWKYYNSNLYIILGIVLISLLPIVKEKNITSQNNEKILLTSSMLFLLLSMSLNSELFSGSDIHGEYMYAKKVLLTGRWDPKYSTFSYNFVMPVIFLFPILSMLTGINLMILFKIVPNILFALNVIVLSLIMKRILHNNKSVFYSLYYFITYPAISLIMPAVPRQQIGELFLSLILLMIIRNFTRSKLNFNIVITVLIWGVVTSHYSTSILYIGFLSIFLSTYFIINSFYNAKRPVIILLLTYILIVSSLFWTGWYSIFNVTKPGLAVIMIIKILIYSFRYEELFAIFARSGLSYVMTVANIGWSPLTILWGLSQLIMLIGMLDYAAQIVKKNRPTSIHLAFGFVSLSALALPLFPKLSGSIGVIRITHLTQYILLPFFGIGINKLFTILQLWDRSVVQSNHKFNRSANVTKILWMILITFLIAIPIVNCGVLSNWINSPINPTLDDKVLPDKTTTLDEYAGAYFLNKTIQGNLVFSDVGGRFPLSFFKDFIEITLDFSDDWNYAYFSRATIVYDVLISKVWIPSGLTITNERFRSTNIYEDVINNHNKIYSSGGVWIIVNNMRARSVS